MGLKNILFFDERQLSGYRCNPIHALIIDFYS